ncbi:MAG: hypothetical protein Q7T82_07555 [Armatimonadota bacterium]|nr:hypothetical protein [Armatimonadota bacterium]
METCPTSYMPIALDDGEMVLVTGEMDPPTTKRADFALAAYTIERRSGVISIRQPGKPPWALSTAPVSTRIETLGSNGSDR